MPILQEAVWNPELSERYGKEKCLFILAGNRVPTPWSSSPLVTILTELYRFLEPFWEQCWVSWKWYWESRTIVPNTAVIIAKHYERSWANFNPSLIPIADIHLHVSTPPPSCISKWTHFKSLPKQNYVCIFCLSTCHIIHPMVAS